MASLMGNRTWRRRRSTLVHRFVNFGLLFWVVWDAVTNDPLTIYSLTGLLFTQSGWTYRKFCSPAWLALTHSVCVCMCAAPECRQCSSRMYWKELSFAPKCFLIAYIFKQTRLKNACKWYNLMTTSSGPIWQVTNPSVLHAIGQSLLSSPGTPLENNRTT